MAVTRNALGRGLGALLSGSSTSSAAAAEPAPVPVAVPQRSLQGPAELRIDAIDPNPDQPRRHFEASRLQELVASIKRHGVLQPVVVRRAGERFELVVGERRLRAAREAGRETIPAVVSDWTPADRLEVALVENVQRADLNPVELAHAYRALADAGSTQDEIATRVGLDRSTVANHLRLLELPQSIQSDVEEGRLSLGHAKAVLQVQNPERRRHLRNRIVEGRLSVREAERLARDSATPVRPRAAREGGSVEANAGFRALAEALERQLQTRVRIVGDAKKGRVEVHYASEEDLKRIGRLILEGE